MPLLAVKQEQVKSVSGHLPVASTFDQHSSTFDQQTHKNKRSGKKCIFKVSSLPRNMLLKKNSDLSVTCFFTEKCSI